MIEFSRLAPPLGRLGLALGIGAVGGAIFFAAHLPLAWMLGSMVACGIAAIVGLPVAAPTLIRPPMVAIIGTVLGSSFTLSILQQALDWPITLIGMIIYVLVAGAFGYLWFSRVGGLDRPTAFFAGMPGGVVEMVTLGAARGADDRMISLIHAARIFLVVLTVPFLIRFFEGPGNGTGLSTWIPFSAMTWSGLAWAVGVAVLGLVIGTALKFPAPQLLGPLLLSAAVHVAGLTDFVMPSAITAMAQLVLGASIGCRFAGVPRALMLRVLALSVGASIGLLVLALIIATLVAVITGQSLTALMLAYSPGGLPEMSLVALSLNVGTAFVVVHHLVRVLFVLASAATAFGILQRLFDRK